MIDPSKVHSPIIYRRIEMKFTDDDLKRLKEQTKEDRYLDSIGLPALLARLEAAEETIESHRREGKLDVTDYAYRKWRKAAGR
jgi:hypothetical protein